MAFGDATHRPFYASMYRRSTSSGQKLPPFYDLSPENERRARKELRFHLPHYLANLLDVECTAEHNNVVTSDKSSQFMPDFFSPGAKLDKTFNYQQPTKMFEFDQKPLPAGAATLNLIDPNRPPPPPPLQYQQSNLFQGHPNSDVRAFLPQYPPPPPQQSLAPQQATVNLSIKAPMGWPIPQLPPQMNFPMPRLEPHFPQPQMGNCANPPNPFQQPPQQPRQWQPQHHPPLKRNKIVYVHRFGESGSLQGQFLEPFGVAVGPGDLIAVADTNNHRIQIFDRVGNFCFQFGSHGKLPGQMTFPNRVTIDPSTGAFVISERAPLRQIQVYNRVGVYIRRFGSEVLCSPRAIACDHAGHVIVVECKVMRVVIFDMNTGQLRHVFSGVEHLRFPNNVFVSRDFEIYISDNAEHCVKVFDYYGNFLRLIGGQGLTYYPVAIGTNHLGQIVIIDNHNNFNVTTFETDGTLVGGYESRTKHAQCLDAALLSDDSVVMCSRDYRIYIYKCVSTSPPSQNLSNSAMIKRQYGGPSAKADQSTTVEENFSQDEDDEDDDDEVLSEYFFEAGSTTSGTTQTTSAPSSEREKSAELFLSGAHESTRWPKRPAPNEASKL